MLTVRRPTNQPLYFPTPVVGGVLETTSVVRGLDFNPTRDLYIEAVGWNRAIPAGLTIPVGLWGPTGTLLASTIINDSTFPAKLPNKVFLIAGTTYRIASLNTNGITRNVTNPGPITYPAYMNVTNCYEDAFATLQRPVSATSTSANRTTFTYYFIDPAYQELTTPPEPTVISSARQFIISLPKDWMPSDLQEWDLQYQKSYDNTDFGSWVDVATLPVQKAVDSELDTDTDPEVTGVYVHTTAEITAPLPYFRYRYRLRTLREESDWSEAALAGKVKDYSGTIDGGDIEPGTIPGDALDPDSDVGPVVSGSTLDGVLIQNSTFGINNTNTGTITGGTMSPDTINAGGGTITALTTSTVTTTNMSSTGIATLNDVFLDELAAITKVASPLYEGGSISLTGTYNGNTLTPGTFNGVGILNGSIDGQYIKANTVTADKMATGFIDANVSVSSYIDASAIKGGQLTLGGKVTYQSFKANDGSLVWPWYIQEMSSSANTLQYVSYPGGPTIAPANVKYTITLDNRMRVDFTSGASIASGQGFRFLHSRANNSIRSMTFTVRGKLPTNTRLELVDTSGTARPLNSAQWTQAGTFTTAITTTPNVRADETAGGLPPGLAIQLRATSAATVADNTYFFEITSVEVEYEKGYGWLNVLDAQGRTRAEVTSEYIQFSKPLGVGTTTPVFRVDNNGAWVPNDGFTIGSSRISNLEYSQRDLSGSLCINPRFENLRIGNPEKILPSDWTYLGEDYVEGVKNWSPNAGFESGVSGAAANGYSATVSSGGTITNSFVNGTAWSDTGARSVRLTSTNPDTTLRSTYVEPLAAYRIPVVPGDVIRGMSCINVVSAASNGCRIEIIYTNSAGTFLTQTTGTLQTGAGVKRLYLEGTVPSSPVGAAYAYVRPVLAQNATASTFDCYIDSVMSTKNSRMGGFYDETATYVQSEQLATGIYRANANVGLNEQRLGYRDGVLPQNQSLVSGRVLTITLPAGYTSSHARTVAISHKRYIQADTSMPVAPVSMSTYFRALDSTCSITMKLYSSSSPSDTTSIGDLAGDTLLGSKTVTPATNTLTVDGQVAFQQIAHSFSAATGTAGDTMSVNTTQGTYIYLTLEVAPLATLTADKTIEFDNVDLVLGETQTPSDNQPIADLARRLTDAQTLLTYLLSGTKAVLPELETGLQGLRATVVT